MRVKKLTINKGFKWVSRETKILQAGRNAGLPMKLDSRSDRHATATCYRTRAGCVTSPVSHPKRNIAAAGRGTHNIRTIFQFALDLRQSSHCEIEALLPA